MHADLNAVVESGLAVEDNFTFAGHTMIAPVGAGLTRIVVLVSHYEERLEITADAHFDFVGGGSRPGGQHTSGDKSRSAI